MDWAGFEPASGQAKKRVFSFTIAQVVNRIIVNPIVDEARMLSKISKAHVQPVASKGRPKVGIPI